MLCTMRRPSPPSGCWLNNTDDRPIFGRKRVPSNKTKRRATKLFDLNAKPLTRDLRRPAKETIQSFGKSWRIPLSNLKRPYIGSAAQRSKKLQRIFSQGFAASDHVVRQLKERGNPSHVVKPRPGRPFMCDVVLLSLTSDSSSRLDCNRSAAISRS